MIDALQFEKLDTIDAVIRQRCTEITHITVHEVVDRNGYPQLGRICFGAVDLGAHANLGVVRHVRGAVGVPVGLDQAPGRGQEEAKREVRGGAVQDLGSVAHGDAPRGRVRHPDVVHAHAKIGDHADAAQPVQQRGVHQRVPERENCLHGQGPLVRGHGGPGHQLHPAF